MALVAASFFLQKLSEILLQEANFLLGVDNQVRSIQIKLEWISSFLKDVDRMPKENERAKLWVAQIRDVAYDVEDVINNFIDKVERQQQQIPATGFIGPLRSMVGYTKRISDIHNIGKEIEDIKRRLDDISANRSEFGIGNISAGVCLIQDHPRKEKRAPNVEEADVVGLEDETKTLVARLIEGEARRAVISVTGMGGIGKTTLAKRVYKNMNVKQHFDCYAWVYVSQEYRVKDLLINIAKCFTTLSRDEIETTSEEDLRQKLYEYLEGKRYLVVIDDIWTREAWDGLVAAFPDSEKGSRLLLTTRNEDIAKYADVRSAPHKMRFLDEKESWTLFCKKAIPRNHAPTCPPNLEKLGREIVAKCGGLPLAVAVLGGVLSRKEKSVNEWDKVLKSVEWWLNESEDRISGILALSYHDLPYYLKPCFLYFGAFPEDSETPAEELISLWIAEGFVQRRGEEEMEDVADDYLEELVDRSMIQVANRKSNATIQKCRIHDLLRDLAISKAKEERFIDRYGKQQQIPLPTIRRLVITSHGIGNYISLNRSTLHLRSFLRFTRERETLGQKQLKIHSGGFKFLRVMDLRDTELFKLPDDIGCLIHLRYLCLVNTEVRSLPSSISCLYNLQTLDVRRTYITKLPADIWKMKEIRHLRLYNKNLSPQCRIEQAPIHHLSNLQTLSSVEAGRWIGDGLPLMTNLRELGFSGNLGGELSRSIHVLVCLRSLRLESQSSIPSLVFSNHQHLYKMFLRGRLGKPLGFPTNLTELSLAQSDLDQDQVGTLEKLPNLRILELNSNAYAGKKLVCSVGGFPLLESLTIGYAYDLEEWIVEEGAIPKLKCLHITSCRKLEMLPDGLQHIITLQELKLSFMSKEFEARVRMNEGLDWFKIRHIPSLII